MHGFLWRWHKDHHLNDNLSFAPNNLKFSGFEKNDLFFLLYAIPAIIFLLTGFYFDITSLIFIGFGITLYGFTYFLVHDIIIHQRIKIKRLSNINNKYFKAVIKAHIAHHRPKSNDDFNNFGLLLFPVRFLNE
ncbi:MAG: Beta-carotene hydroxylase [Ignavibacteriae bacterium]|nr:MAG: Beta-carotene hydroxylase [Ignavibacteriota bacterium]